MAKGTLKKTYTILVIIALVDDLDICRHNDDEVWVLYMYAIFHFKASHCKYAHRKTVR